MLEDWYNQAISHVQPQLAVSRDVLVSNYYLGRAFLEYELSDASARHVALRTLELIAVAPFGTVTFPFYLGAVGVARTVRLVRKDKTLKMPDS